LNVIKDIDTKIADRHLTIGFVAPIEVRVRGLREYSTQYVGEGRPPVGFCWVGLDHCYAKLVEMKTILGRWLNVVNTITELVKRFIE
jgi:hypothetical protein